MTEILLQQFHSLDAWQCRVFGLEYPQAVEELPDNTRGGTKGYRMGYLYLTITRGILWVLTLRKGKTEFHIGGSIFGSESPSRGISRSWVESVLFWNCFLDIRKLDMYQKVLGYLRLHPELLMTCATSKSRMFREAALEVLDVR